MGQAWVRVTLEYPIECDPGYLDPIQDDELGEVTFGTWHRSMGTWCADNLLDELAAALPVVGSCLCPVVKSVTVKAERDG